MVVVLAEQSGHIALEDEGVDDATERAKGRGECDMVDHPGPMDPLLEEMLVAPTPEGSALHLVDKCVGPLILDDLGGHPPANAEVAGALGHMLTEAHAPRSDAVDDAFGGRCGEVNFDIDGDVKADGGFGRDLGDQIDARHVRRPDGRCAGQPD
jgi:hypothetical protein